MASESAENATSADRPIPGLYNLYTLKANHCLGEVSLFPDDLVHYENCKRILNRSLTVGEFVLAFHDKPWSSAFLMLATQYMRKLMQDPKQIYPPQPNLPAADGDEAPIGTRELKPMTEIIRLAMFELHHMGLEGKVDTDDFRLLSDGIDAAIDGIQSEESRKLLPLVDAFREAHTCLEDEELPEKVRAYMKLMAERHRRILVGDIEGVCNDDKLDGDLDKAWDAFSSEYSEGGPSAVPVEEVVRKFCSRLNTIERHNPRKSCDNGTIVIAGHEFAHGLGFLAARGTSEKDRQYTKAKLRLLYCVPDKTRTGTFQERLDAAEQAAAKDRELLKAWSEGKSDPPTAELKLVYNGRELGKEETEFFNAVLDGHYKALSCQQHANDVWTCWEKLGIPGKQHMGELLSAALQVYDAFDLQEDVVPEWEEVTEFRGLAVEAHLAILRTPVMITGEAIELRDLQAVGQSAYQLDEARGKLSEHARRSMVQYEHALEVLRNASVSRSMQALNWSMTGRNAKPASDG